MPVLIVNCGLMDGSPPEGRYLREYDPDWIPPGTDMASPPMCGRAIWTDNMAEAKRYPDAVAAWGEWKRQSTILPLRPWDGKPNRPLTAYTISLQTVVE